MATASQLGLLRPVGLLIVEAKKLKNVQLSIGAYGSWGSSTVLLGPYHSTPCGQPTPGWPDGHPEVGRP
jgi:hypothetical protein